MLALALCVTAALVAASTHAAPVGAPAPLPAAKDRGAKAKPVAGSAASTKGNLKPGAARRPLTLAAQNIEGRAEGARVLFVHTGPKIALADAPRHPSYLRDDFTAALSSPVTVHVRNIEPLRTPTTPGGSR
jgi:hypothetical protein